MFITQKLEAEGSAEGQHQQQSEFEASLRYIDFFKRKNKQK